MSVGNAGASSRNNELDMQRHRMNNKQVIMTESSSMDDATNDTKKYYYLTPNAVQKLPNYQYHGADLSLLYKYILSPLAGWCVDNVTPTWLAPNAITSIGLCWMILSYGVIWYHCPGLYEANTDIINTTTSSASAASSAASSAAVPSVIFLLNGCAMLIYQTLDNMDGKQARKTGSSSPLGLLFDHGCDALNSIFGSANWIVAMGLLPGRVNDLLGGEEGGNNIQNKSLLSEFLGGDAIIATVLVLAPMIPFFVATWEHYFTGKLILPIFNGPSEGLVMGASLSFLSYFYGPMIWQQTTVTDGAIALLEGRGMTSLSFLEGRVRNLDIIVLSAVIALIQELLGKIPFVIRSYGQTAVRALLPHIAFVISTVVIISVDSTILLRIPRTMLHLISGVFVEQTTQLMLDHMVEERYAAFRWPLLPQVFLASILTSGVQLSSDSVDIYCITYTTGLWIYLVLKIKVLVSEICDVLGIWCFDIVSPHPKRKKD